MKSDQRVQLTKRLLREALLKQMNEKPFAQISVKGLCDEAGLNRTTFYLHYQTTEDLLREIELNRTLARFDSLYGNTEDGWEISYGEIPEPDDGTGPADGLYPFHIELTDGTETREINGELKCRETEDGWKISELRFDLPEE